MFNNSRLKLRIIRNILQYNINNLLIDPKGFSRLFLHDLKYIVNELFLTKWFVGRYRLAYYSLLKSKPNGLLLEFGVANGESINYLASILPNRIFYGFDCFSGLPEAWYTLPRGHFKVETLPTIRENVKLVSGMFQDTLSNFLAEHEEKVRFLHLDADLYSSTFYVLKMLIEKERLQEGTVIQFDELFNYTNWWKDGEFKALQELTLIYKIKYEILGFSFLGCYLGQQVAIKISKIHRSKK